MSELTPMQWRLYDYLKLNMNRVVSKKELAEALGYSWIDNSERNGRDIEKDVFALRDSEVINRIIISNNKGYKIATEKEADEWLKSQRIACLKKLKMLYKNRSIAELNNQMRLVFGQEKDCIEVF